MCCSACVENECKRIETVVAVVTVIAMAAMAIVTALTADEMEMGRKVSRSE